MPAGTSGCYWNAPPPLGGSSAGCLEGLTGLGKSRPFFFLSVLPLMSPIGRALQGTSWQSRNVAGTSPTPASPTGILKRLGWKLSDSSFTTGTDTVSKLLHLDELLRSWWLWWTSITCQVCGELCVEPDVSGKPVDNLSLLATLVVLRQMIGTSTGSRADRSFWGVFAPT